MKACVQRVARASVLVEGEVVGAIGRGLLVLLGVAREDTETDARLLAEKISGLRIFEDDEGKMNRALADVAGSMLVVSQFTLLGNCRRGRRPDFTAAAGRNWPNGFTKYSLRPCRSWGFQSPPAASAR